MSSFSGFTVLTYEDSDTIDVYPNEEPPAGIIQGWSEVAPGIVVNYDESDKVVHFEMASVRASAGVEDEIGHDYICKHFSWTVSSAHAQQEGSSPCPPLFLVVYVHCTKGAGVKQLHPTSDDRISLGTSEDGHLRCVLFADPLSTFRLAGNERIN